MLTGAEKTMKNWVRCIPQAQRGEPDAMREIVAEFQDMAVGYAYSVLGDFHLAEDAAQEAFIQCYKSLPQLEEPHAFPAWFRQIVFRQCNRLTRRSQVSTVPMEFAEEIAVQENDPAHAIEQIEMQDRVHTAVRELPEREREVTALFYVNGYSMSEVGAFLDVPVTTVKNRLHSARSKLKEAMIGMVEETLKRQAPGDDFRERLERRLHWRRLWITEIGCLKGCLDYLDRDTSVGWLMGGTGHAFVMNIMETVCAATVTAWDKTRFYELGKNIGYSTESVFGHVSMPNFEDLQKLAWDKVRQALDKGKPCYGWDFAAPEFYVIHGYDDKGYLYRSFEDSVSHLPWQQLGRVHDIGVAQVWIVSPVEPADDRTTVREALEFAIEIGRGRQDEVGPPSQMGLPGYDLWIHELETGSAEGFGLAFNSVCWEQCRHFAVEFLREAGYRTGVAPELWQKAMSHYKVVAENLAHVSRMYPFDASRLDNAEYDLSETARRTAAGHIRTARQAEEAGLAVLDKLVAELDRRNRT